MIDRQAFLRNLFMALSSRIRSSLSSALLVMMLFCRPVSAQDENVRIRYNEAIDNIVKEINKVKAGYPELESFSKNAVNLGKDGFQSVFYLRDLSGSPRGGLDPYAYSFSIRIAALNSEETKVDSSSWEVKFPLLGVKVVLESQRKGEWVSFDLRRIVENNLDSLRILEQEFLPFRLELSTDKPEYSVLEGITLMLTLKNMGPKPYKVADLDEKALYCSIGDREWGSPDAHVDLIRVLNGHGTIQRMLRIIGPETPQELSIACTYALGYKGVQPYQRIKVSIQPKR